MQYEEIDDVNAFIRCVNDNVIGGCDYNYKYALDYARDYNKIYSKNFGELRYIQMVETQKAIWCFIHNKKKTTKNAPIYTITKEQLENFNRGDHHDT